MSIFSKPSFSRKSSPWDNLEPVREELFSAERIEDHARSLAAAQLVTPKPVKGRPLAGRLAANGAILLSAYKSLLHGADEGRAVTPAAEWLIDNYHLIEKQIREIRSDLPAGYYRQLPKLAVGPFAGYPRVFGLAWAFVAHTDSRFDSTMLVRFVRAYQEVQPLTIGELWAVSITLRIVMIENLRRLAVQIVAGRAARRLADDLADRLLGAAGRTPESLKVALANHQDDVLPEAFAVQLIHRLRDQDPTITPALTWLDQRLAAQHMSADIVVREIHRRQGATSVTVRNIITSLRLISDVDWKDLFEDVSLVDDALAADGGYKDMDFPSRNLYRTAIEELARGSDGSEREIAERAVAAARRFHNAAPALHDARKADPGYHLIGGGREEFENTIGYRPRARKWRARLHRASGIGFYVGAIGAVAAGLLGAALVALAATGLNAAPDDLVARDGRIVSLSDPSRSMSFREAAAKMDGEQLVALASRGDDYAGFRSRLGASAAALTDIGGVQFAEVTVDAETGLVRVERVVAAHDCGRPINPAQIESQLHGGVLQGLGYALIEQRLIDRQTGRIVNGDFEGYKAPGVFEAPKIDALLIENYQGFSATDAYGIAEPSTIPTAPAIANAVYNAIGVRLRALPMNRAAVLAALAGRR